MNKIEPAQGGKEVEGFTICFDTVGTFLYINGNFDISEALLIRG